MRNIGWWIPISFLLLLGTVTALLSAAPSLGESELQELGAHDPAVRASAVEKFVSLGATSDLLDELGRAHSPLVKSGLAEAVRRKGVTSDDVTALGDLLTGSDVTARYLAAGLLSPVASQARSALAARAKDPDETTLVRAAAARTLGAAGPRARTTLGALATDETIPSTVRQAAIRALAGVDEVGTDDARALVDDTDRPWADRACAIQALAQAGQAGRTRLVGLTASKEAPVRKAAARALVASGDAGAAPTLAGLLGDPAAGVRYVALQGLEVLGMAASYPTAVFPRLGDMSGRVQALAARLSGQVGGSSKATVIPKLKGLLASTNFRVRYEAALALKALGDKSGATTMLTDRASKNPSVAKMAAAAYRIITGS